MLPVCGNNELIDANNVTALFTAIPADQPVSKSYRLAAIELVVGAYPCRRDSTVRWYGTKNSNVLERDAHRGART